MRDTYRYHFLVDDKIVYTGITRDLCRRYRELYDLFDTEYGDLQIVGDSVELIDGLRWESKQTKQGRPTRRHSRLQSTEVA